VIFKPDIVKEGKATVHRIQENLKAVKSRQETYANKRHRSLEFEVGDHVYLRVSPMKGMKRFGVKGKLVPRYIGPFPIIEKCGTVAYKLNLPPSLVGLPMRLDPRVPNACVHVSNALDVRAIMGLQDVRVGSAVNACNTCEQVATVQL
jgi:hypothetical protein